VHAVSYYACGVNDTAYIVHARSLTLHAYKKFEYFREFEFIFEKALAPYLGAQDGCFDEKTEGRKSRDIKSVYITVYGFNGYTLKNFHMCDFYADKELIIKTH
jgi:hypothetical protein